MIEPSLRDEYIYTPAQDSSVAVLLVDLVLGYGAHPDPASGLAAAITHVKETFAKRGQYLSVVASITGTDADPQGLTHAVLAHITREGGR